MYPNNYPYRIICAFKTGLMKSHTKITAMDLVLFSNLHRITGYPKPG
jgi:hypothetical protein